MTSLLSVPRPHAVPARSTSSLLVAAVGAGVALGALDLLLQVTLPYPLANLANSSAVWALAAFALAVWARTTPVVAAAAGVVLLVVAVEAYYVVAIAVGMADAYTLVSSSTVVWMASGVLAGAVFGVAGSWVATDGGWRAALGLAAASAVLLAEAAVRLLPGNGSSLGDLGTTSLHAAAGVAVLLAFASRPGLVSRAALLVLPLTLIGTVAFHLGS
jgi:hypothetical protein